MLNDTSGYISDGYNLYPNNLDCGWIITSPGDFIRLEFRQLSTEYGLDYVRVYLGDSSDGTLIGEYSGSEVPVSSLVSFVGSMYVEFTTFGESSGDSAAGFVAMYQVTQFITSIPTTNYICKVVY